MRKRMARSTVSVLTAFFLLVSLMPALPALAMEGVTAGDADSLRAAIEDAVEGDIITIPSGTYTISETIWAKVGDITIKADNSDEKPIIKAAEDFSKGVHTTNGGADYLLSIADQTGDEIDGITLENVIFDVNRTAAKGGITVSKATGVLIDGCEVKNGKTAISIGGASEVTLRNFFTKDNAWNYAIEIKGGSELTVGENVIIKDPAAFYLSGDGIVIGADVSNGWYGIDNGTGSVSYYTSNVPIVLSGSLNGVDKINNFDDIAKAFDAALEGDTITLPPGKFVIGKYLQAKVNNLKIVGATNGGTPVTTIKASDDFDTYTGSGGAKYLLAIAENSGDSLTGVSVSNIIFDVNTANNNKNIPNGGITISKAANVIIDNCQVINGKVGVIVTDGSTVEISNFATSGNLWGYGVGVEKYSLVQLGAGVEIGDVYPIVSDDGTGTVKPAEGETLYKIETSGGRIVFSLNQAPVTLSSTGVDDRYFLDLAVAVAATGSGDVITLAPGEFLVKETLVIPSGVTVRGAGASSVIKPSASFKAGTYPIGGYTASPIVKTEGNVALENLTVSGPFGLYDAIDGIFSENGPLTMKDVTVEKICNDPLSGMQHGKAVIIAAGDALIEGCSITDFQKNAIDFYSSGLLTVTNTTIRGIGPNEIIGQNGIFVRNGKAKLTGNTISNISYTKDDGWQYASCGIALFGEAESALMTGNTITSVDNAISIEDGASVVLHDTVLLNNHVDVYVDSSSKVIDTGYTDSIDGSNYYPLPQSITISGVPAKPGVGDAFTLSAAVAPDNAYRGDPKAEEEEEAKVTWSSSDESIATVDQDGEVTLLKVGNVTITASITVEVMYGEDPIDTKTVTELVTINVNPLAAGNIVITQSALSRTGAGTVSLSPVINYNIDSDKTVTFTVKSSSDASWTHTREITLDATASSVTIPQFNSHTFAVGNHTITLTLTDENDTIVTSIEIQVSVSTSGGGVTTGGSSGRTQEAEKVEDIIDDQVPLAAAGSSVQLAGGVFNTPFVDISSNWAISHITALYQMSIINGVDGTHFGPGGKLTRAQAVQLIYNAFGDGAKASAAKFKDVNQQEWYAAAINWACEQGIVTGYNDDVFGPNDLVLREQIAAIIERTAGKLGITLTGEIEKTVFTDDSSITGYARDAVYLMQSCGIINGIENNDSTFRFDPKATTTRDQTAKIIYMLMDLAGMLEDNYKLAE